MGRTLGRARTHTADGALLQQPVRPGLWLLLVVFAFGAVPVKGIYSNFEELPWLCRARMVCQ